MHGQRNIKRPGCLLKTSMTIVRLEVSIAATSGMQRRLL
jgi:hypothetical protein